MALVSDVSHQVIGCPQVGDEVLPPSLLQARGLLPGKVESSSEGYKHKELADSPATAKPYVHWPRKGDLGRPPTAPVTESRNL